MWSDRIPPEYVDVMTLRGGPHGGVSPTDAMFDFFESVSRYTDVSEILEFGFLYGMSAAIQLTVHPDASLTAYDIEKWDLDVGHTTFSSSLNAPELARLVWDDRFTFEHKSSTHAIEQPKDKFDYAFVDGLHTFEGCYSDLNTVSSLNIPYVFVDNVLRPLVQEAINESDLLFIDELYYPQIHPFTNETHIDKICLYEVQS